MPSDNSWRSGLPEVGKFLALPYARTIFAESDGSFRGEILEFPGCIATGTTAGRALTALERAAAAWLEETIQRGQSVPEPFDSEEGFSGKLVLRLPKSLHRKAAFAANMEGVSLNQFLVYSLAEAIGEQAVHRTYYRSVFKYFLNSINHAAAPLSVQSIKFAGAASTVDTTPRQIALNA